MRRDNTRQEKVKQLHWTAFTLGLVAPYRAEGLLSLLPSPLLVCIHIALARTGPLHGYLLYIRDHVGYSNPTCAKKLYSAEAHLAYRARDKKVYYA